MKVIKSKKRKKKALLIINIRKEYREFYNQKIEDNDKKHNEKVEELNHFFQKSLKKQNEGIEKKYRTLLNMKEEEIQELRNKLIKYKKIFAYIKEREQDLENIITIVGNKMKGFAELVTNGYSAVQNSFSQVEGYGGYNKKHIENDAKVIEALNDLELETIE